MKNLLVVALVMITVFACKDDKKPENVNETTTKEVPNTEEKKEDNVVMTLNVVVPKDDTFVVQFTEDMAFQFEAKDKIKVDVKGSDKPQDLVFKLPNKVIPTKFMLKVGRNNYKDVSINKLTINSDDRVFEISKENFYQFFNPNKYIDYNREEKTFTSKEIDGRYIPTFISRPVLIQRLEEIVY